MSERDKLLLAKSHIDALANGIDPVSGVLIPEGETIHRVQIAPCFFYVSKVLERVSCDLEQDEKSQRKSNTKKLPFALGVNQRVKLTVSSTPISVSVLARKLSEENGEPGMAILNYAAITHWLESVGFMRKNDPGKSPVHIPTEQGLKAGMSIIERQGSNGPYLQVLYNSSIQRLIANDLPAILALRDNHST